MFLKAAVISKSLTAHFTGVGLLPRMYSTEINEYINY